MATCPVCRKDFKNVEKHLLKTALKDEKHKEYVDSKIETVQNYTKQDNTKQYKAGQEVVVETRGAFQVIEDRGNKLMLKCPGTNFLTILVKKEKLA